MTNEPPIDLLGRSAREKYDTLLGKIVGDYVNGTRFFDGPTGVCLHPKTVPLYFTDVGMEGGELIVVPPTTMWDRQFVYTPHFLDALTEEEAKRVTVKTSAPHLTQAYGKAKRVNIEGMHTPDVTWVYD